jgi:hypothetical protein
MPFDPLGIGQFCGEVKNHEVIRNYRHLGKRIKFEDLNDDCQQFVRARIEEDVF